MKYHLIIYLGVNTWALQAYGEYITAKVSIITNIQYYLIIFINTRVYNVKSNHLIQNFYKIFYLNMIINSKSITLLKI